MSSSLPAVAPDTATAHESTEPLPPTPNRSAAGGSAAADARRTRWAGLPAHGPGRGKHLPLGHLTPALAERFDAPIDFGGLLG
ncbi:hypothetical protein [Streptomyces mirabilis]|uniref:hypothetical protein n=1 Tax=Streptomyces mirabilis TaxID=68239 RepID=UPI00367FFA89